MNGSHDGPPEPSSEVGSAERQSTANPTAGKDATSLLLSTMETLLSHIVATQKSSPSSSAINLLPFDPDVTDADIEGWCNVTEAIVQKKQLAGIDLLISLTSALKGRAAACLTNLNLNDLTWNLVKQNLIAKFFKPKLCQDYFDDILRFQIGSKETASEAAIRLWNLIERLPKTVMPEEVITGFVTSVLCQKDSLIRRELNAHTVTTRAQLFRILGGISMKRRFDAGDQQEIEIKRPRITDKFTGKCHHCGLVGHRLADCRKRRDVPGNSRSLDLNPATPTLERRQQTVACYKCGELGHLSPACQSKKNGTGSGAVVKEVSLCEHRPSRGTLYTSSGESVSFLFDSGSSCSLVKEGLSNAFRGSWRKTVVYLRGIGGDDIKCTSQIFSKIKIGEVSIDLLFHIVPDSSISEPVIIGRDILKHGVGVQIDNGSLKFYYKERSNACDNVLNESNFSKIDTDLVGHDRETLLKLLNKYSDCFTESIPSKRVKTGMLQINLIDPHKTVQRCPYRLAPTEKQIVREKIQQLLDAEVIRESSSPFASPILLVKKKDNTDRMCVDYRELNSNTRPEHYPLPRIEEQIDQLSGANFFSSLDMASGFHQIPIHPDSVEKTAFVTPEGQYEYLAMPFGLRNAPSVYQRCINSALNNLENKPLVYMDDVLCYSSSVAEGLQRLEEVLSALSKAGFSLNLRKCKFLKNKIDFLGYTVQSGKASPNSRKIKALTDSPPPKTATQVRQFLGLASYFRKFIQNFTHIVGPLYPLTKLKGPIKWTEQHEKIRYTIIDLLTSAPVLTIFNPSLPVELHTDASSDGYGAILIQKRNNLPQVVEYYSRRTSEVESRYHSYELETLAVVRAVEHFRHYLYGRHFEVYTDCNSLKASKNKKDLTPRVHRWWAYLQGFDFDIIYREGSRMAHADYLSRNPLPNLESSDTVNTITVAEPKTVKFVELHHGWLSVEQKRDQEIQDLITKYNSNGFPETVAQTYDIRDGLLYRKVIRNKIVSWLPVVPRSLIWTLINHVHNEVQHLGKDKTLDKLYEQYWFPQMSKCVRKFVDSCIICKASKGPSGAQPVQLHPIPKVAVPWHTIHIDFTGKLSGKSDRKEYCSVIIDAFTKYVLLEHTSSLDAQSAVQALRKAVCLFGAPKRIIADQGRSYISADFKNFCKDYNIHLHYIATGSSRANGQVERVMRTLKSLLTIVENDPRKTWRDELGSIQLALNSTKSTVTKYSPSELMFGIRSQSLGLSKINVETTEQQNRLDIHSVRNDASINIKKAADMEVKRFNRGRAKIKPFSKGDFVFIKNSERNQTKLDKKFKGPFVITNVLDNDRYELKSLSGSQREYKYAHENLRLVPPGHEGLLEITTSLLNDQDEEAMTAPIDVDVSSNSDNAHKGASSSQPSDTLTACSDTLTVCSDTLTALSDTLSADSDTDSLGNDESIDVEYEVEIHAEQDSS